MKKSTCTHLYTKVMQKYKEIVVLILLQLLQATVSIIIANMP